MKYYSDVFPEELPKGLSPKRNVQMIIYLKSFAKQKIGLVYKLSRKKLEELELHLETALSNGFIRPSVWLWGVLVLFVPKKTGKVPMCRDYQAFNTQTINNQVSLPRIDEG